MTINSLTSSTSSIESAITIQRHVRGHLARKPFLPHRLLYRDYSALCEKAKGPESHSMPRALGGRTKVYLPIEMPEIALKDLGQKKAIQRFHQMREVRSVLDSQKSSHLVIPKAKLCGDFLIEQRLPIKGTIYHNLRLYNSQPEIFDGAVRDMVRLFSKMYLSGLIDKGRYKIRYDNLPFYVEKRGGKEEVLIGLIDLERIRSELPNHRLEVLAIIFPFHLDLIKKEAQDLGMTVDDALLDIACQIGKSFLLKGQILYAPINYKS